MSAPEKPGFPSGRPQPWANGLGFDVEVPGGQWEVWQGWEPVGAPPLNLRDRLGYRPKDGTPVGVRFFPEGELAPTWWGQGATLRDAYAHAEPTEHLVREGVAP